MKLAISIFLSLAVWLAVGCGDAQDQHLKSKTAPSEVHALDVTNASGYPDHFKLFEVLHGVRIIGRPTIENNIEIVLEGVPDADSCNLIGQELSIIVSSVKDPSQTLLISNRWDLSDCDAPRMEIRFTTTSIQPLDVGLFDSNGNRLDGVVTRPNISAHNPMIPDPV